MYQLRFLIGSPRRLSPHLFSHRDYRGQRTVPDDFHPEFKTYVCQPTGSKSSYEVMQELMQHAAQHQQGSQLFPVVELYNPQTGDRLHLQGNEIILRPQDLEAAQKAFEATTPVSTTVPEPSATPEPQPEPTPEPATQDEAPKVLAPTLASSIRTAVTEQKKTALMLSNDLGVSPEAIKAAVAEDDSGLINKGGWISLQPTE